MKPASKKPTGPTETPAAKAKETKPKTTSKASAKPAAETPAPTKPKAVRKKAPVAAAAETQPKAVRKPKAKTSSPPKTAVRLIAHVDVGLGNTLYFRGWGGGLRWDSGTPAVCTGLDKWELELHGVTEPVHFKVLINDEVWSDGPDLTAIPSGMLEFNPAFG